MTFTEILAEARRIAKATSISYPTTEITTSSNRALERATALIRDAQNRWQWDDSDYTDFPRATRDIVDQQQDYELDPTHYRIERVEIRDIDGNWHKVDPIDEVDVYNQSLTDFLPTAGLPRYYDKVGNSILLYPKPSTANVTENEGLKVFYQRGPDYFTTSDTTKAPGFNPLFHSLIPLWCAYDYAFVNSLPSMGAIRERITLMEEDLKTHYALRDIDDPIRLETRKYNFR